MEKVIMTFKIHVNRSDMSSVEGPFGGAYFVPFRADVKSDLFTGKTRPGACDVQTENLGEVRHMCAKYLFEGTDQNGAPCKLFVENNGWMNPANKEDPFFQAVPTFVTDSRVLGEYLCQNRFRSEVQSTGPESLDIRIIDTRA
ncbi:MAG: hypothetical protein ACOYBD_07635 [Bilifractor sp.]|jgi:hypothetical protein